MAEEFSPHKPPLKLLVVGHQGHGKTTLVAALMHVLTLNNAAPRPSGRGVWGRFSAVIGQALSGDAPAQEFSSTAIPDGQRPGQGLVARGVKALDAPASGIPDLIAQTGAMGGAALLLVVSAADGPMPQTQEHVQLAKLAGATAIVVFVTKSDMVDDETLLDLVELEVRELLKAHGFNGNDSLVFKGSATKALQARSPSDPWAKKVLDLAAGLDRLDDW